MAVDLSRFPARLVTEPAFIWIIVDSNAIVMRDNANRLALAERIISDLRKSSGVVTASGFPSGSEAGFVLDRRAAQTLGGPPSALQSRVRGPVA
jgi:hypothetical protein